MRQIVLVVHNVRSTHNVGSLLRTADGLGGQKVYLTGYTPFPLAVDDNRLPHLAARLNKQIAKTALGAESHLNWQHRPDIEPVLEELKSKGYQIVALEQDARAISLPDFQPAAKIALVVGREVEGIEAEILDMADVIVQIPMLGKKESLNVVQAAAIALYHCRFFGNLKI